MALPQTLTPYEHPSELRASARIRRCTFRRLSRIPAGSAPSYEVSCLYPDRRLPLPIGDQATSLAICEVCTASHIFRPDED